MLVTEPDHNVSRLINYACRRRGWAELRTLAASTRSTPHVALRRAGACSTHPRRVLDDKRLEATAPRYEPTNQRRTISYRPRLVQGQLRDLRHDGEPRQPNQGGRTQADQYLATAHSAGSDQPGPATGPFGLDLKFW